MIRRLKSIKFIEAPNIGETGLVTHAFCTRLGGVSQNSFRSLNFSKKAGDSRKNVGKNLEIWANAFNIDPAGLLTVDQVHSDRILAIKEKTPKSIYGRKLDYDAIITDQRGVFIGVLTADCLPIILLDPRKKVVGIIHAGWQGTSLKITHKTVKAISSTFGSLPQDLLVGLGPAIGSCCYEVDRPVVNFFKTSHTNWSLFIKPTKNQKWTLNLSLLNQEQLLEAGILEKNIYFADLCTSCNDRLFFSHRRDKGKTGRQLSFIGLK